VCAPATLSTGFKKLHNLPSHVRIKPSLDIPHAICYEHFRALDAYAIEAAKETREAPPAKHWIRTRTTDPACALTRRKIMSVIHIANSCVAFGKQTCAFSDAGMRAARDRFEVELKSTRTDVFSCRAELHAHRSNLAPVPGAIHMCQGLLPKWPWARTPVVLARRHAAKRV